jgi:hypothetical protein
MIMTDTAVFKRSNRTLVLAPFNEDYCLSFEEVLTGVDPDTGKKCEYELIQAKIFKSFGPASVYFESGVSALLATFDVDFSCLCQTIFGSSDYDIIRLDEPVMEHYTK